MLESIGMILRQLKEMQFKKLSERLWSVFYFIISKPQAGA